MTYSIIIPTYNHLDEDLRPCIESLVKMTTLLGLEVVVVSNGSTDGTDEYVRNLGEPFRLLSYPKPLGYTRAMNAGISVAEGEFVVPFNNDNVLLDVAPKDQWLAMLRAPFDDPAVGLSGPVRQHWAGRPMLPFFCVMVRRKLFWDLGMLDEAFSPGAGEDTDFCMRAHAAGHEIVQVPNASDGEYAYGIPFPIWHKGGRTVRQIPGWGSIIERNTRILDERYPRLPAAKQES